MKRQLPQMTTRITKQSVDLRMRYREIGLIRNLSQRHDYRIPMVTEEGVGMIHLTLVQDAKEKGRISVHLNTQELGTVSVEAKGWQ